MSASEVYLYRESCVLLSNGVPLAWMHTHDEEKKGERDGQMILCFLSFVFFLAPNDGNGLHKAQVIKRKPGIITQQQL